MPHSGEKKGQKPLKQGPVKTGEPTGKMSLWSHRNFQNFLKAHFNYSGQTIFWGFEGISPTLTDHAKGDFLQRKQLTSPCPSNLAPTSSSSGPSPWKQETLIWGQVVNGVAGKRSPLNNSHRCHSLPEGQACLRGSLYFETIKQIK